MSSLVEEVKRVYSLSLSAEYVERMKVAQPLLTAQELYRRALCENLSEVCERGVLPYGIASQTLAVLSTSVVLQINSARDTTQPLHFCADVDGDEKSTVSMAGIAQRNSPNRLLRLVLSDGFDELPAVELRTLRVFRDIPIPGEKLLIKAGAEVRHGMLILSEEHVVCLGGEVAQLKQEFVALRRRTTGAARCDVSLTGASQGLDGVPRFAPLQIGSFNVSTRRDEPPTRERPFAAVQATRGRGGVDVQQRGDGARGQGRGRNRGHGYSRAAGRSRGGASLGTVNDGRRSCHDQTTRWPKDHHRGGTHYDPSAAFEQVNVRSMPPALDSTNYPPLTAVYHST